MHSIMNTISTDSTNHTGGNMKFDSKESIYLQIFHEYKKYIELGVYKNNDKLPSVRSLAEQFSINPNTVQRAYQLLEEKGYITTLSKKGVYVCFEREENPQMTIEVAKKEIEIWKHNNLSKEEILRIVEEVYRDRD